MSKDEDDYYTKYDYGNRAPINIKIEELTDTERELLMDSKTFCMLPWVHLHAYPDGKAYPCCLATYENPVGSMRDNTMEEIFHNDKMNTIRSNMVNEKSCDECTKCYEQERNGFFSMRNTANQSFGHNIKDVDINNDGTTGDFKLRYYDIRFSNLCNLACRSCGDIFSSKWVKEKKKYNWLPKDAENVTYAGRYQTDAWEQLLPHIPYIQEVYFAGGEPLMMEEHYKVLKELLRQGRNDVKLSYNTNFTELKYKSENVLEMWKEFDSVSIGASLDASYERGELMRYGTKWKQVVLNREEMMRVCPDVDFYVSSTMSVMNAYHIPDFHREWIKLGLVRGKDWNVNILQGPDEYRMDILPQDMKKEVEEIYNEHIAFIEPSDDFHRATNGFKSALNFMNGTDNTYLIPKFNETIGKLDTLRNEHFYDVFPELMRLKDWK